MVDEHMAPEGEDGHYGASTSIKPVEAGSIGGKVAADAEAGKAEEDRRREADLPEQRAEPIEPAEPMTKDEAKILAPVPGDMPAGHHFAQKFGNDPANPKPLGGMEIDDLGDDEGVMLSRKTPDHPDLVFTRVHPGMVGDYLRAGWNVHRGA